MRISCGEHEIVFILCKDVGDAVFVAVNFNRFVDSRYGEVPGCDGKGFNDKMVKEKYDGNKQDYYCRAEADEYFNRCGQIL